MRNKVVHVAISHHPTPCAPHAPSVKNAYTLAITHVQGCHTRALYAQMDNCVINARRAFAVKNHTAVKLVQSATYTLQTSRLHIENTSSNNTYNRNTHKKNQKPRKPHKSKPRK